MNQLILSGIISGGAPELRYSPKGTAVCKFTIEARNRKGQNGEDIFEGRFDCFGPTAEYVASLAIGTPVIVVGKLATNRYKDKAYTNLIALTVVGAVPQKAVPKQAPVTTAELAAQALSPSVEMDDVPF